MDDTTLKGPGVIEPERARAFLARAGAVLQSSLDYETTLTQVSELAVPELADWCAVDVVEADGELRALTAGNVDDELATLLLELRRRYRRRTAGSEGVLHVIERGEPELVSEVAPAPGLELGASELEAYARLHPRSYMIVPLVARDRVLGALTLLSVVEGRHYQPADLEFASELASACALAVDNARLYREAGQTIGLLDALFTTAPVGLAFLDPAGRFVRVNAHLAELHGVPAASHVGRWPDEVAGPAGAERAQLHRGVLASGRAVLEREVPVDPGGRRWLVSVTPVPAGDGTIAGALETVIDVTEHRALLERERAGRQRAALLARAGEMLESMLDFEATLRNVAHMAVPEFCDWCTVSLLEDGGGLRNVAVAHVDPERERWAWELNERYPPRLSPDAGQGRVLATGRPEVVAELSEEALAGAAQDAEHERLLRELKLTGVILAPLRARGRTLGTIAFISAESGKRFDDDDVALAVELGRRAGMAVDNARLYTARAAIAHTLQSKLLPKRLPAVPGIEIAARYRAAGELIEVGGDFYDVLALPEGDHLVVVGDVTGKGAEAAAVTALARFTLRTAALHEPRPSGMLKVLNDAMRAQADAHELCTVCAARVVAGGDRLRVVLALGGHEPALVLRASGLVEEVGSYGSLLGLLEDPILLDAETELGPGDVLILHTDGMTDAGRPDHPVGQEGFVRLLERHAGRAPDAILEAAERMAVDAQEGEPRDDIAMVALRLEGGSSEAAAGNPTKMQFSAVEVPGGPQAPATARRFLLDNLGGSVPEGLIEDAGLLVSELVTNAVMHGRAGPAAQINLRLGLHPERVRIEVSDPGPGFGHATSEHDDQGGYGLFLVTQIADAWGVATEDEPTTVWFELRRPA